MGTVLIVIIVLANSNNSENITSRNDARQDLKLLWLHGGITETHDGFRRTVEHSPVHALVCCHSWT